jgi:hypothetical protein
MIRAFFVFLCANLLLSGCTQRLICPAYQSAFIYDQEALRKKFSYFQEDSTPKIYTASKNKYLVAEDVSYKRKIRSMQTVAMKPVNVNVPDSLKPGYEEGLDSLAAGEDGVIPGAELDLAARSVIDSTYIVDVPEDTVAAAEDSVYVISKDREVRLLKYDFPDSLIYDPATGKYAAETPKYTVTEVRFNVEQDNYMWYLRDYLVLPDVRLAHLNQGDNAEGKSGKGKKEKKGFFGFFKNLFKKKKKEAPVDSAALQPPVKSEHDFDYVDEDEQLKEPQTQAAPQKKKKGLFSFLKKDKAPEDQSTPPAEKPAKKKKEKKQKDKKQKEEEIPPAVEDEKKEDDEGGF